MTTHILCLQGQLAGRNFALDDSPLSFGRAPGNAVEIVSKLAGRHHAEVRRDSIGYVLHDLESRNGTLVNGVPIDAPYRLRSGDQIAIADEVFEFQDHSEDHLRRSSPMIVALHGELAGRSFIIEEMPLSIGRGPGGVVEFSSKRVSRRHAEIRREATGYILYDLGSQNGTFVNEKRITSPHQLQAGDQITIGDQVFRFEETTDDDSTQVVEQQLPSDQPGASRASATLGIECPVCSRVISPHHQHCPWDGALLANGHSILAPSATHVVAHKRGLR